MVLRGTICRPDTIYDLYFKKRIACRQHLEEAKQRVSNSLHHAEKLVRAYGGCLGAKCRRRTWVTAKSLGES